MKIRIKFKGERILVTFDQHNTSIRLSDLKDAIRKQLNLTSETAVEVSLNGKDDLEGDDATLSELGLVSGDLVIITKPADQQPKSQVGQKPLSAQSRSHNEGHKNECAPSSSKITAPSPNRMESAKEEKENNDMEEDIEPSSDPEVNRYLREPMLIRDATENLVPQKLTSLFKEAGEVDASDAVCVVLHLLMLETGYACDITENGAATIATNYPHRMPEDWKSPGVYKLTYNHVNCPGAVFKIVCVTLGRKLVVHACAEVANLDTDSLQLQLYPEEFISCLSSDANQTYKSLPKLSQVFKDKISFKLIEDTRQAMALAPLTGFSGLYPELKFAILQYLDFQSLVLMSGTCCEMKNMARDPLLWRRLYLKEFRRRADNTLNQDWLKLFKEAYIRRKEMEEMIHRPVFIPGHQPFPSAIFGPPLPYAPGAPSGIIGGDYDIDPFGFHGNMIPRPIRRPRPPRPDFPGFPGLHRPPRGSGGLGGFGPRLF